MPAKTRETFDDDTHKGARTLCMALLGVYALPYVGPLSGHIAGKGSLAGYGQDAI